MGRGGVLQRLPAWGESAPQRAPGTGPTHVSVKASMSVRRVADPGPGAGFAPGAAHRPVQTVRAALSGPPWPPAELPPGQGHAPRGPGRSRAHGRRGVREPGRAAPTHGWCCTAHELRGFDVFKFCKIEENQRERAQLSSLEHRGVHRGPGRGPRPSADGSARPVARRTPRGPQGPRLGDHDPPRTAPRGRWPAESGLCATGSWAGA